MKQPIFTPPIEKCAVCGAEAKCIDWNFNMRYRVMCDKNHIATGEFNTRHRAICRWNNEQKKVTSNAVYTTTDKPGPVLAHADLHDELSSNGADEEQA